MTKLLNHKYKFRLYLVIIFGLITILLGLFNSCVTVYDTINNRNFASQYNPGSQLMHPEYSIYMISAKKNHLYFRFFPNELKYFIPENDSIPQSRVSLFFRITDSYTSTQIIDSLTSNFVLRGNAHKHFLGHVPIELPEEGKYIIEVFLTDLVAKQTVSTVIEYDYLYAGGFNSFLFLSQYGNPLFYPYFSISDTFRVRTEMYGKKEMWVAYYKADTAIPIAPDIQKNILLEPKAADTSWIVENPDTTLFSFADEGTYFFSTNGIIGKPFTCFNGFYPYIKTPEELLKPLIYLCSKKEMHKLNSYANPKQAVDSFWLQTNSDVNKSRELIRIYYNRIQLANYYFTDFKAGWLTDRGMIYVICGAPANVRKTDEGEYWIYGKGDNNATQFFFYREKHPLFGTTYILERSDLYSRMWFNAITTWRDGRVFSLNPLGNDKKK